MTADLLGLLVVDIVVVVLVARVCGWGFQRLGQPPVLGEILGGIALGPTLLGALPGDPSQALFPDDARSVLAVVGLVALLVFMLLTALELDHDVVRRHDRAFAAVAVGALVVPLALGVALAVWLYGNEGTAADGAELVPFALFVGTAFSITALPVLARIVADRGLLGTPLGELSIATAAVMDVCGWLLLAGALALHATGNLMDVLVPLAGAAAVAAGLVLVVRPMLRAAAARVHSGETAGPLLVVGALAGAGACAVITELIGLHAVIGAFAFGLAFPRRPGRLVAAQLRHGIGRPVIAVGLPVYFLVSGLNVDLGTVSGDALWQLGAVLACAFAGKLGGAYAGARLAGWGPRDAAALGTLLNARGLIEVVVLNVGLDKGIIDSELFGIMLIMAMVSTFAAGPLVAWLARSSPLARPA